MSNVVSMSVSVASSLAAVLAFGAGPNLESNVERPLRYQPDGIDFVAIDGRETFNRPLYGSNITSRVDAGDRPEFSLFLPGRGGVLRLGIKTPSGAKWFTHFASIDARYRAGSMLYRLRDPLLGDRTLDLAVEALAEGSGLIVRATLEGEGDTPTLVIAFGGANGETGARNGDIGTERVPMSEFFSLKPEHCSDNAVTIEPEGFRLTTSNRAGTLFGLGSAPTDWRVGDANAWDDLAALTAIRGGAPAQPVAVGETPLAPGRSVWVAVERPEVAEGATPRRSLEATDLRSTFDAAINRRLQVASWIKVNTPDPFINAAVPALCIAADGTWDDDVSAIMHGAVAWRIKLLGWRGAYWPDALGQPERLRRHLNNWFPNQNVEPIAETLPPPEPEANLARNHTALHSNGNLIRSHYDMNLVAIDALFRHLRWTGDLEYARSVWPVVERHLAWERRMFRRTWDGDDGAPLYEAYAAIWASDDLFYNGGGATHTTAYNLMHNREAARIARLIGVDPTPYEREAQAIERGLARHVWVPQTGTFAEWKDLLGEQSVRNNPAVWTFYHTVDSEAATPPQAWQMSRFVDTHIARLPLRGPGVPDKGFFTTATTNWMPYSWSINNVVMAESQHTALAYWQSGRREVAYQLFKGALLDHMFMGLCPGNVGMTSTFDVARGEAQRDFADGVGALSRTLVEGLLGVRPDALAGVVTIAPGWPADWQHASFDHPSIGLGYRRDAGDDVYVVDPRFDKPMAVRFVIPARADRVTKVQVNGADAKWTNDPNAVDAPRIIVEAPPGPVELRIAFDGHAPAATGEPRVVVLDRSTAFDVAPALIDAISDPQRALASSRVEGSTVVATPAWAGHRTAFVVVRQGDLRWTMPIAFEARPPLELVVDRNQPQDAVRFRLRNNAADAVTLNTFTVNGTSVRVTPIEVAPGQVSDAIDVRESVRPGTNVVTADAGGGRITGRIGNWRIASPTSAGYECVDLSSSFNDRVTSIFANEYLAPRSPFVSLAVPKQGIGTWCKPTFQFPIDDTGLRALAAQGQGQFTLPQGIPFLTAHQPLERNVAFVSQWSNYPRQITAPLSGRASHAYLLVAGSTTALQSHYDNGRIEVAYTDGSVDHLLLRSPDNWWPIDQDFLVDDFAFRRDGEVPPRIDLKTGEIRLLDRSKLIRGRRIEGGAATVIDMPLRSDRELHSITLRAHANEIVLGLLAVTLERP